MIKLFQRSSIGFSMIELLIAVALGAVITTGILQLFSLSSKSQILNTSNSRMQENARFALDFLTRSIRTAGYVGCASDNTKKFKILNASWDLIPEFDFRKPIQVFHGQSASGFARWEPSIVNALPVDSGTGGSTVSRVRIPGNGIDTTKFAGADGLSSTQDILVVRHLHYPYRLEANTTLLATTSSYISSFNVNPERGNIGTAPPDILYIGDCDKGILFRATVAQNTNTQYSIGLSSASGNFANKTVANLSVDDRFDAQSGFHPNRALTRPFGVDAHVAAPLSTYYYIAESSKQPDGLTTPALSLWSKVGTAAPVELVQNVDELSIAFGVDTNLDDLVPRVQTYIQYNAITPQHRIVAVRFTIAVAMPRGSNFRTTLDDQEGLVAAQGVGTVNVKMRRFSRTVMLRNAQSL